MVGMVDFVCRGKNTTEMWHCVYLLKSLCDPELLTSGSMFSFIQSNSEICGFYNVS